ncbi:unnamed protein product [Brassica rapa]|uniref:Uncharacterized protein n=2 Tax=Brassica TaxID=3705 RepID=A0A8D9LSM8_BRACM|nr:unnamed protein product [Brassica napus]CAG7885281.1 unnamed protein product [Brassica rapa]
MLQNLTADDVKEPVAWKENGVPLLVPLLDHGRRRDLSHGGFWRGRKTVTVNAQTNRKVKMSFNV